MALNLRDAAAIIRPRTYQNRSAVPFVHEDEAPAGCTWEFDYRWSQEDPYELPMIEVDAIRLVTHDGTEYPIRISTVCPRWLAGIESLIAEEVAADNEAAAEARR